MFFISILFLLSRSFTFIPGLVYKLYTVVRDQNERYFIFFSKSLSKVLSYY